MARKPPARHLVAAATWLMRRELLDTTSDSWPLLDLIQARSERFGPSIRAAAALKLIELELLELQSLKAKNPIRGIPDALRVALQTGDTAASVIKKYQVTPTTRLSSEKFTHQCWKTDEDLTETPEAFEDARWRLRKGLLARFEKSQEILAEEVPTFPIPLHDVLDGLGQEPEPGGKKRWAEAVRWFLDRGLLLNEGEKADDTNLDATVLSILTTGTERILRQEIRISPLLWAWLRSDWLEKGTESELGWPRPEPSKQRQRAVQKRIWRVVVELIESGQVEFNEGKIRIPLAALQSGLSQGRYPLSVSEMATGIQPIVKGENSDCSMMCSFTVNGHSVASLPNDDLSKLIPILRDPELTLDANGQNDSNYSKTVGELRKAGISESTIDKLKVEAEVKPRSNSQDQKQRKPKWNAATRELSFRGIPKKIRSHADNVIPILDALNESGWKKKGTTVARQGTLKNKQLTEVQKSIDECLERFPLRVSLTKRDDKSWGVTWEIRESK